MTYNYEIDKLQYLIIGQQGENNATEIVIDMSSWADDLVARGYDNPCFHLLFLPYNRTVPVVTSTVYDAELKTLTWTITSQVTAYAGMGYVEVRALNYPDNGLLKKSRVIPTTVSASVTGVEGGVPPAPYDDWLNSILALINQLNNALNGAVTEYAVSTGFLTHPESGWSETMPDLVTNKGKYLWSRTTISWSTGGQSKLYNVSYIAMDASGAVTAINGYDGNVVLDGSDIKISRTESDSPTVAAVIAALQASSEAQATAISTVESAVQSLDAEDIAYDRTGSTSTDVRAALDEISDDIEEKVKILPLVNSAPASPDAPDPSDYLVVGEGDASGVTRRPIENVLTAANLLAASGGYVVKRTDIITLTRASYEVNKAVTTSDNASLRIRRGWYTAEIPFNETDIPIAVEGATMMAWLHYEQPAFTWHVTSFNRRLYVQLPFTQMYTSNATTPSETILAQVVYLAAT